VVILELKAITVKRYLVNELISIINDYVLNDTFLFASASQVQLNVLRQQLFICFLVVSDV